MMYFYFYYFSIFLTFFHIFTYYAFNYTTLYNLNIAHWFSPLIFLDTYVIPIIVPNITLQDTRLLHTNSYVVMFSDNQFLLHCVVQNKPFDAFGAWFNNSYILSCNARVRNDWSYTTEVWLNKVHSSSKLSWY